MSVCLYFYNNTSKDRNFSRIYTFSKFINSIY